ncbi:MAG: M20/M25/M40 family metallo-hydrolase [Thermomonas sp.]|uniref:M20/M25/M40 family metallo-hydrolase n=1 Tax=Thermomonas sp. TaxID=1971895 RepID=UPI0039E67933
MQTRARNRNRHGHAGWQVAALLGLALLARPAPVSAGSCPARGIEGLDAAQREHVQALGLGASRAPALAHGLLDRIGPRLTGSPGLDAALVWASDQARAIGLARVRLEDWGVFGHGWTQQRAWMRMQAPVPMMFVAQAAPWSVASAGVVQGDAAWAELDDAAALDAWRGRLRGKVLFLGALPPQDALAAQPSPSPRFDAASAGRELDSVRRYFAGRAARIPARLDRGAFRDRLARFLMDEGVQAVVLAGDPSAAGSGTARLLLDDSALLVARPWQTGRAPAFPVLVAGNEGFGRVARLLRSGVQVQVEYEVATTTTPAPVRAANLIAEIPGTDPCLRGEAVEIVAHLDSWAGATGAVDDGAGVIGALEAMRIIRASAIAPRRTIRMVLFTGEEQGVLGSRAYVDAHYAQVPRDPASGLVTGAPVPRAAHAALSLAMLVDMGSGPIRGIYAGADPAMAALLRQWQPRLASLGVEFVLDGPGWPADQSSYTDAGLPALLFLQDPTDYMTRARHTSVDAYERLDFDGLTRIATVQALLALDAAQRDAPMPRPQPLFSSPHR